MTAPEDDLVGVVLAAGRGSRMRPLTDVVPKPLLTIDNVSLLELALDRVGVVTNAVAVNAHHLAEQIAAAARAKRPDVKISDERERLLGTAGALFRLRDWIAGRSVVVVNSDVWLSEPIGYLLEGWNRRRPRLLVVDQGRAADFGHYRFLGVSTLPAPVAAALTGQPDGLYSAVWRDAYTSGELEFVELRGEAFDCGTPAEFMTANFHAAGRNCVVAADAQILGHIDRCVVLAGGRVEADEHLVDAVRDRFGQTVFADPGELG